MAEYSSSPILRPQAPTTTGAYESSIPLAFRDYAGLQSGYGSLLSNPASNPISDVNFNPLTFSQSPEATGAIKNLQNLSQTGGYSDADVADLRARGISPIRAIYANMQRELSRNKGLSGGYSPNFAAVSSKLAREESQQVATQTSNVNAGIAQNRASNKLSIAPTLASATQNEESRKQNLDTTNETNRQNVDRTNVGIHQFNTEQANNNQNHQLDILRSMQSLYGTTPALASTFGSQALGAAGINAGNDRASVANPGQSGAITPGMMSPFYPGQNKVSGGMVA